MKKIIFLLCFLPLLAFGQGQRLGINPVSFNLSREKLNFTAPAFCSDGYTRSVGDSYKYFQNPEKIKILVDGKPYSEGIYKLIEQGHISLKNESAYGIEFSLSPQSKYKNISISFDEPNLISESESDFNIEKVWLNYLKTLRIVPEEVKTFSQAEPYIKTFQVENNLTERFGLLPEETRDFIQNTVQNAAPLKELGYLENGQQLISANKLFQNDWGKYTIPNHLIENLTLIDNLNKDNINIFKTIIISKTSNNEYATIINNKIFREKDEKKIANKLSELVGSNEGIDLILLNFESPEKEEAFLSTLRIENTVKGKKISVNKSISSLAYEKVQNMKLTKQLQSTDIKQVNYHSEDYYSTTFEVMLKSDDYYSNTMNALATKKSILEYFITKTNSIFADLNFKYSLLNYFYSFKKDIKQTLKIQTDDEFMIILKNNFEDFRIVKISGDDNIYVTMK